MICLAAVVLVALSMFIWFRFSGSSGSSSAEATSPSAQYIKAITEAAEPALRALDRVDSDDWESDSDESLETINRDVASAKVEYDGFERSAGSADSHATTSDLIYGSNLSKELRDCLFALQNAQDWHKMYLRSRVSSSIDVVNGAQEEANTCRKYQSEARDHLTEAERLIAANQVTPPP
jgi:hypothetical protein